MKKNHLFKNLLLIAGMALSLMSGLATAQPGGAGAVFVGTNHINTHPSAAPDEPANQIVMYRRAADGSLSLVGYFDTGGQGSGPSVRFAGDGLGSAHSVQLTQDRRFLLTVNAGSNDISVFRVRRDGLELTDLEPSGGIFPNSLAIHRHIVYVLNSAGDGNITGFRLSKDGLLTPLLDSTRSIDANQDPVRPDTLFNPTQVSFTPNGRQLVVTIKDGPEAGALPDVTPTGAGRVLVFNLDRNFRPAQTYTQTDLANLGPFGFSFDRRGHLLTALFIGGPGLTGSVGSFQIAATGKLVPITLDDPTGFSCDRADDPAFPASFNCQLDTCWLENNGRYAYGANYTSGTISSYRISTDGSLSLLDPVAGITDELPGGSGYSQGSTPLDLAVTGNGRFLYNVLPGSGAVAAWEINRDGSLSKIGEFGGLPETLEGDHAPFEFGPGGSPAGIVAF